MQPELSDEITDLLVAYALGALEPDEHGRVSRLLRERPELRMALAELRATADALPHGLPVASPPPDLRQKVLDRAVGRAPEPRFLPAPERPNRLRGWLLGLGGAAAALLLALALMIGQLTGARAELAEAQLRLATAQAVQREVAAILAQPVALVDLAGAGGRGSVLQSAEGELLLAAQLPPLEAGRVYQLWLIAGTDAPVSAGIFEVDANGNGLLTIEAGRPLAGATLAVTNEPAPGSPGPTSAPLIAGEVS